MILEEIDDAWPDEQQFLVSIQNLQKLARMYNKALNALADDESLHIGLRTFISAALLVADVSERA